MACNALVAKSLRKRHLIQGFLLSPMKLKSYINCLILVFLCCGCDFIYTLLQREGAEEKQLLGEIVPLEYNAKVAKVQSLLKLYGYRIGSADGVLGPNTREAIEQFQQDTGLTPSRFVDNATWEKLTELEEYGLILEGDLNIAAVQQALTYAGVDPGPVDGQRGPRTEKAIEEFQTREGLVPDGRVGYQTLQRLKNFLADPQ